MPEETAAPAQTPTPPTPVPGATTTPTTEPTPSTTTTAAPETTEAKSLLNEAVAPESVPESYSEWKVPEGWTLDEKVSTDVNTLFKEIGLSQSNGQRLVDFYIKQAQDAADAPYKMYEKMRGEWRNEVANDPDIGSRLDHVKQTISKALNGLGDPKLTQSFREAMDLTGAGDHPAFIRAFYRMAQRLTEQSHVVGNGPSPAGQTRTGTVPRSVANAMYPDLPSSS